MLTLLLIIIYFAFIGIGLPSALLGAAWPSMYESIGVPNSYLGIASIIIMGSSVIASTYSGKLIKYFRTSIIVTASAFMMSAGLLIFAFSGGIFIVLCICAIPLGLGVGAIDAVLNNYVALHFKAKHMNWLHCFWGVGATLGPIILAHGIRTSGSWHLGYIIIGGIHLALALILVSTLSLWKKIPTTKEQEEQTEKASFKEVFRLRGIKCALLSFFCYTAIESTVGLWGSSYLVIMREISPEVAARWVALFFLGITLGRLLAGFISARLNNHQLVRLGYIFLALGIAITLLPFASVLYMIGFFLMGLGCAPIFPCLVHDTPGHFGKENSGAVVGLQVASAYIGSSIMPPLFGAIAVFTGFGFFLPFLIILLIGMIIAVEKLNRKSA